MFANYKSFWDDKASTVQGAMIAVDGSCEEEVVQTTGKLSARQVTEALELCADDRVLELGCGVARIGKLLAPHIKFWQGVDISENMVKVARERLADVPNAGADALERTSLSMFADGSFDKAYSVAVFIHMDKEDFFIYLQEIFRVLRPGGRIYFDTWNLAHPVGWSRYAYEVDQHRNADPSVRKDVARNQFSTPQEVSIYLREAGFDEVLMMADSPWIQAVAVKPGGEASAEVATRLGARRARIAYSPLWTELFEWLLRVIIRGEHPRDLMARLQNDSEGDEIEVFRTWLRAYWKQGESHWGPCPV